ncbi:hypothetical protein [Chryseobacterium sp.]|uniref:hypothetical protein n=1 Tax=Chryseobacterium sp. TaxID=1871047 RepID=UPI0025C2E0D0|nr:hypothetical protein [Chryseobacterium sp.]MBV8326592.1 hypothetical protein [Chryseobacterium sp.]
MIRRLRYNEIDFRKYTACLEQSEQYNGYARKETLDQLSGNWHILVYNDYEAVMPVNIVKKFGLNFVHMPLFCQQLGVFSKQDDPQINDLFLHFLKKKYLLFLYTFNHHNVFSIPLEVRKNYIIPVSDYSILKRKKYFKGRKSTVKWSQHLIYREVYPDADCFSFIENHFKGLSKEKDLKIFKSYFDFLANHHQLKLCGAYLEDRLINLAVLISEPDQLSLLALVNDETSKKEDGASFVIDKILENNIGEKKFNFMGSNIRGIEVFFKSFGGELNAYPFIENKLMKKFS